MRPKDCWNMFDCDLLKWCLESMPLPEFLHSLFEVREIIEPNSAALAAKRATPEQIEKIEKAYHAMEEAEAGAGHSPFSEGARHFRGSKKGDPGGIAYLQGRAES